MIGFSIYSLLITLAVFLGVRFFFLSILPPWANPVAATLLILIVSVFIVNFIFAYRAFKNHPNGRLHNPDFHRFFFRNLLINLVFILLLNINIFF
jgi:hypothetical protein